MKVLLRGGNVTSHFITKYLGEVNHENAPKEARRAHAKTPRKAELCIYKMVKEGLSREGEDMMST